MSGPLLSSINSGLFFYFVYVFFLPGAVIWFFRSLFVVGRPEKLSENFIIFIILSSLYAGLVGWPVNSYAGLVNWPAEKPSSPNPGPISQYFLMLGYVVVGPALLGTAIGVATQKKGLSRLLSATGLPVKTSHKTGWEWLFDQLMAPVYVIVVLEDGSKIYGFFGNKSLASSDPDQRDIFLEEIFDFDETEKQWKPLPEKRGILIVGSAIRHIEVWNFVEQL